MDFEALFRAAPNAYLVLAPDLTMIEANEAYLRAIGRPRTELIGQRVDERLLDKVCIDRNFGATIIASLTRVLSSRRPDTVIGAQAHADESNGGRSNWQATHTPILNAQGSVIVVLQHLSATALQPRDCSALESDIVTDVDPVAAHAAPSDDTGLRIVLVEDNDTLRSTIAEYLKEFGHDVTAIATAEDALSVIDTGCFQVLFTDVSLPNMSGMALARAVRARYPDMALIITSGFGGDLEVAKLGANALWLPKPYDIAKLEALLAGIRTSLLQSG